MKKLLQRDEFREKVFSRDNHTCVVPHCFMKAKDAHHIIERRLWDDGGYYLDNGASLCELHHKLAEITIILPRTLREYCKINRIILPNILESNKEYTKWGVEMIQSKRKIFKYPTTCYLPFSYIPESHNRDTGNEDVLLKVPLVITGKMDGSNIQLTNKKVAARNGIDAKHKSFDLLKSMHHKIKDLIPENLIVFGEWLFAKHSIHYKDLKNYLQLFAIYNSKTGMWSSWSDVCDMAKRLGVITVPVEGFFIYDKKWKIKKEITNIANKVIKNGGEGLYMIKSGKLKKKSLILLIK